MAVKMMRIDTGFYEFFSTTDNCLMYVEKERVNLENATYADLWVVRTQAGQHVSNHPTLTDVREAFV